jgi:selenide,water dikinase
MIDDINEARFIDLAADGGCSKKGPAKQIRELLRKVQRKYSGAHLETISENFPDTGIYPGNGKSLLSTVDIVLPMTAFPADFGKITVNHVLSDLYASGGLPLFALCLLGVRTGNQADKSPAVEVMTAAAQQLSAEDTLLVGGHTMTDQEDFYLGFAAVGRPIGERQFEQAKAEPGDSLILTKPLGTSIATLRWKSKQASDSEHRDVIEGMLKSNRQAAISLSKHTVRACTDVTGYGFFGHLYNVLFASKVGARIEASRIACYPSLSGISHPGNSRQLAYNREYVQPGLTLSTKPTLFLEALLFDSQVSGGLLVSVPADEAEVILAELRHSGYSPMIVGEVVEAPGGRGGTIELVA